MTTLTERHATYAHRLSEIGQTPDEYVVWLEQEHARMTTEDAARLRTLAAALGLPQSAGWRDVLDVVREYEGDGR